MNKQEFFNTFIRTLNSCKIPDTQDIIAEYEEHFEFKLADGYSEDEIAAKLGDPVSLAKQFAYDCAYEHPGKGSKTLMALSLVFADIFVFSLFILLYAWVAVMSATAIVSAVIGVCLIANTNIYSLLPPMPYGCAVVYAISMLTLASLSAVGTAYCLFFVRQLIRCYYRWHRNKYAAVSGKPIYPSLPKHPQLSGKAYRFMRNAALISLSIFAVSFIIGYIVSALSAGALGFWHVWNWFV